VAGADIPAHSARPIRFGRPNLFSQAEFHEIFRVQGIRLGLFRVKIGSENDKKIKYLSINIMFFIIIIIINLSV
jgi:hypothetical protein